ncbi:hypothetical protein C1H46_009202 [Malus baccata]|uniref:Uncharacterized protein n=1 Tax=Malus baccata TaxID=106549 RepID=A0A540N3V5_MALBA|nr:hypothetical protein C1H46_009202 [Malus baccata]
MPALHDHIPLHAYIHINGYGSFLGFRGTNRGSRAAVAGGSASASAKKLAVNGYAGPSSSTSRLTYNWTDSCLVIPPPAGKKPRAIIKFLGGAFIGAVRELTYSNGALLQVLAGSYFSDKVPKDILFVKVYDSIVRLGPLVNQMVPIIEASPVSSVARTASGDAWNAMIGAAGAMLPDNQETLSSVTKFVDQLPSVLNEVAQGISEFKPTPSENCDFFKSSYNVKHTLLVKFNFDAIDETYTFEETLKPHVESIGGTLEKVESVQAKLPRRLKRKRPIVVEDGGFAGFEEYIDYLFPEEAHNTNWKLFEAAYHWKRRKDSSAEDAEDKET